MYHNRYDYNWFRQCLVSIYRLYQWQFMDGKCAVGYTDTRIRWS